MSRTTSSTKTTQEQTSLFKTLGNNLSKLVDTSSTMLNSALNVGTSLVGSADIESRKLLIDSVEDYEHDKYQQALNILKQS